ncbi:hypothetical protein [Legionella yabuuchiae]|uniref:hypothetical protein n=1 Tax=Legionella yabuuchiae TaxID=376727 RepID=UPI001054BD17|nr:hypothetical protein [Legionella yabuuchiae]
MKSFQQIIDFICEDIYGKSVSNWNNEWKRITEVERYNTASYRYRRWPGNWPPPKSYFHEEVDAEYNIKFTNNILPHLRALWLNKISAADFPSHLNRFFKRHPWLSTIANNDDKFVIAYISPLIKSTLDATNLSLSKNYSYNNLGYYELDCSYYEIQWPAFNDKKFMHRMHDYPLDLIYGNHYEQFLLLPSLATRWPHMDASTYHLSRLDVYRLLFTYFGIKASPPEGQTQLVANIMPVELGELKELDLLSKSYCQSWLINLDSVDNPYWIFLDKYEGRNSLYISSEIAKDKEFQLKLEAIKSCFSIDEIVTIDNKCETKYTYLPDNLIWQYQLFARVLPYCMQSHRAIPLETYRNRISLYHLVAYVWEALIKTSFAKTEQKASNSFQYADPFTEQPWHQLLKSPPSDKTTLTQLEPLHAEKILASVDQKKIQMAWDDKAGDKFQLTTIVEGNNFLQSCFMACFQSVHHIALTLTASSKKDMPDLPLYIFDKSTEKLTGVSFAINSEEAINPGHFPPLVRLSNSAACNRLLLTHYRVPIADLRVTNRWDEAGRLVFLLFNKFEEGLSQQAIQNYLQQDKVWRQDWYNPAITPKQDSFAWRMAQFAQMGHLGTDAFFGYLRDNYLKHWHAIHQTPQLNLSVLFDLNGDHLNSAAQYIEHLCEELTQFIRDERCIPKFKQIHFVLPQSFTRAALEETAKLIRNVNDCRYIHSNETEAFFLYEFKTLSEAEQDGWLCELEKLAALDNNPLITMIRIPELNTQVSDDAEENALKARYQALQNKILDNQRLHHEKELANNTLILYQGADGTLDPMVDIRNLRHRLKQPFTGKDETVLLSSNAPGIQQELQQNIEARHEIAHQVQKKRVVYEEQEPDIKRYDLDLSRLFTRHNIEDRLSTREESVSWAKQFSLWVGSDTDAYYLINYIEPEALKKIRQYESFFQLGIVPNHLPFGFFLSSHPNVQFSYILCFDEDRAKREQYEWEAKTKEIRNPFIPHLDAQAKAVNFDGDYRQFDLIGKQETAQISFWYHLATQSLNSEQHQQQVTLLRKVSQTHFNPLHPDIPIVMSRYELSGNFDRPWNTLTLKKQLALWAETILGKGVGQDFISVFILTMNETQLKSFGQLCYHYDSKEWKLGSHHFLRIAFIIFQHFGEHNFRIWKNAIFDNSENATELLAKPVLDALGFSLITLKDKSPAYISIWFRLLEAQVKHVGWVGYDRLWYAYQIMISYIDHKGLKLDDDLVARLLNTQVSFQSLVWLDRLFHCLKKIEGQFFDTKAQQHLLDNLDKIDWQHNGLFYAMSYNAMPYWSEDLKLEKFTYSHVDAGYTPSWDKVIDSDALVIDFGRYLAAQLKINFNQYQYYVKHIKPSLESNSISYPVARLLLINLKFGGEEITDWGSDDLETILPKLCHDEMNEVVAWWNQQFKLDEINFDSHYKIPLAHLPLIAHVLKEYGLKNLVTSQAHHPGELQNLASCGISETIALLNALGKTCQYLQSQSLLESPKVAGQLIQMTEHALKDEAYLAAMRQTPWLLIKMDSPWKNWFFGQSNDVLSTQKRFLQQLESISFLTSTWLPNREDIQHALSQLDGETIPLDSLDNKRRELIATWVGMGCDITEQDATFRRLTRKEEENFIRQFTDQLLPQYTKENAALITILTPHLAIEADFNPLEQAFTQLIKPFKRIDNKPHFNDLAITLGSLIHHIKQQGSVYMSLQQLSEILDSLMLAQHDEVTHFPNDMLNELLTQTGDKLTNHRLNELTARLEPPLKDKVKLITQADIPHQIKSMLLRLAPKFPDYKYFNWIINNFIGYRVDNIRIDYQIEVSKALLLIAESSSLWTDELIASLFPIPVSAEIQPMWLKCRYRLLTEINKAGSIAQLRVMKPLLLSQEQKIPEIEMIGIYTLAPFAENSSELKQVLSRLDDHDLKKLADYCAHPPTPSADYLIQNLPNYKVDPLIHHFETVDQAKDLRHYSVTEPEGQELKRVLGGIKEKNTGYISDDKQKQIIGMLYYVNAYAQEQDLGKIRSNELKAQLRQTAQWLQGASDEEAKRIYRLQLLSMLRELLLRQTGKWANHTQMLALIYTSLHNDESVFYQIKTGEGKSIITIMRVAFHALNAKIVDVFTAKESLSSRDHEEFGYILDAIGIENSHIVPDSDENSYKVGDDIFGAVNYMTPSSFSLFQSGHCWSEGSRRYINYCIKERVAFFDEGDHVLLDEQTMFNFSYSGESNKLYNYDAWVYQATWRYFQTIKDALPINEKGIPYICRTKHLAELCEYIQQQSDYAPIQSSFIKTYLAPVVDENIKDKQAAIVARDKVLADLLSAAYTANNLVENQDYCVQQGLTTLSNNITMKSRVAKVVINNQVQDGATFSERVHQFLHVRLNETALTKGEQPNFFIAPDSAIVLSQNVPSLIKHYYGQIEGCSGTMGDPGELNVYKDRYDIQHVVKLPTHEVSQTVYEGMISCDGQDEHEQTIIQCLQAHQDQPTLLVSKDDVAVKALSKRLYSLLPETMAKKLICDTNDSGLHEKDILPYAGKPGFVINSSRMARGTDIKPEVEQGLLVIRSNPDMPRFTKQSGGRQGRNGAKGMLIDIIDYAQIRSAYEGFAHSEIYAERLSHLLEREWHHLKNKFAKHQKRQSNKWNWLINDEGKQEKYIQTRVVQCLRREIKIQREQNIRSKEALVSECSSHIIAQLMHYLAEDQTIMRAIRKDWLKCRESIESAWQQRMTGALEDNEVVLDIFYEKAKSAWKIFAVKYPDYMNSSLLDDKDNLLHSVRKMKKLAWNKGDDNLAVPEPTQHTNMPNVIAFYQGWLKSISPTVLTNLSNPLQELFYGQSNKGLNDLNAFYHILIKAGQAHENNDNHLLIRNTKALFSQLAILPIPTISYVPLKYMSDVVKTFDKARSESHFMDKLSILAQLFAHPCAQPVSELTAHHMTILGECIQFIVRLTCRGFVSRNTDAYRRFTTEQTATHVTDVLWQCYWQTLTPNRFASFDRFINQDDGVAKLLTTHLSSRHWQKLLGQLVRYDMAQSEDRQYLDQVMGYYRTNQILLNNDYSKTLNALLDIFLHYPHRRIDTNYFPAPNSLLYASNQINTQLIYFIAEQYMINAFEAQQLVNIINESYGEDKFGAKTMEENVMPSILSLPANIPFEMINKRVKRTADQHNLGGFQQSIIALTEVGNALNNFTNRKGITTQENSLPSEGEPESLLKRSQAIILQKDGVNQVYEATKILVQLSQAVYDSLDPHTCLIAVEQYDNHYQDILDLLLRAKTVMEDDAYITFYNMCFTLNGERRTLKTLTLIINTFEQYEPLFATSAIEKQNQQNYILQQYLHGGRSDSIIEKLKILDRRQMNLDNPHVWQQWQTSQEDSRAFDEKIQFIKETDGLPSDVRERVCDLFDNGYDKARLLIFTRLTQQDKITPDAIPDAQLLYLLNKWNEDHIHDGNHLKNVFDAQKLANILATETSENAASRRTQGILTFESLFGAFNHNNQGSIRVHLMHSITHSLITYTDDLHNKCWTFYHLLMNKVGNINKQIEQLSEKKRSAGLSKVLKSLKGLSLELYVVAKPQQALVQAADHRINYYYQLIESFEKQYIGRWYKRLTVSSIRRGQAQSLFSDLKKIADPTGVPGTQADFYISMLNVIDKVQEDIINHDEDNKIGAKKGYCHLLDITQALGLQICKDLSDDDSLNDETKKLAHNWLLTQEKRVVLQLWQRLPSNHPIVHELAPYARNIENPDYVAIHQCQVAIAKLQSADLPKEVRYLLPLLKGHFEITEEMETSVCKL